ncbi:MAG: FKBP-type peptidyl-prolyl cis-trans isomerase [Bacteroidales bacterium]|jgi:FKBP-type peptidyl-prolyl cis-trans isomerase SlyD|nr:FKBP-type peptidyl-prolyl cis-trans isomerase [Bacteroidales bacterium]
MNIENDALVALTYTLKKDNAEGEVIEVCSAERPLEFVYGAGMMLPHFEKHLAGLAAGANYEFTLAPDEAYGEFTTDAIVPVNKDIFADFPEMLEAGRIVPMRDAQGNPLHGRIITIDNDKNTVTIDFNHPMAGQTLHFNGTIESVRKATEEDMQRFFGGCGCACSGDDCNSDCSDKENCGGGSCGCN